MVEPIKLFYEKKGAQLVENLKSRHFEAYYCDSKEEALEKVLSFIPEGSSVGWGGAMSAQQVGVMEALAAGNYKVIDRDLAQSPEEREQLMRDCLGADFFLTGANAISMDGQMVNIDGYGNRCAAIIYGPQNVIVIAGMNKVTDDLDSAITRARTVAAPMNQQRFCKDVPCTVTGTCSDCKSADCICNQMLITRHGRAGGRIKFIIVGENLGL